jgi:hypothetical protein
MEPRRIVQLISLLTSLSATFVLLYYFFIDKQRIHRLALIAPILYLVHLSVFYSAVLLSTVGLICAESFSSWSSGVRLHSVITVLVLAYVVVRQNKLWN